MYIDLATTYQLGGKNDFKDIHLEDIPVLEVMLEVSISFLLTC